MIYDLKTDLAFSSLSVKYRRDEDGSSGMAPLKLGTPLPMRRRRVEMAKLSGVELLSIRWLDSKTFQGARFESVGGF